MRARHHHRIRVLPMALAHCPPPPTTVSTRFGDVEVTNGTLGDVEAVHVARHGAGHARLSHQVDHRANLSAIIAGRRRLHCQRDRLRRD